MQHEIIHNVVFINLIKTTETFAGGKDVDDMQDELKNLLFGDEDAEIVEYIGKPSDSTKINRNITRAALQKQRKVSHG